MKNILCSCVIFAVGLLFTMSVSAQCTGGVYTVSLTWQTPTTIHGYSSTQLDYCDGVYYDPATSATFTEVYNGGLAVLGTGYTQGYADWVPAEIYLDYAAPVNGLPYTTTGIHYVIAYYQVYVPMYGAYYWYDPWQLGFGNYDNWGFMADDYFGYYSYVSYWISSPQFVGATSDTVVFQGQTQCPAGQPFTPTGVPCTSQPPPPPPPPDPPSNAIVTVHAFTNPLRPAGTTGSTGSDIATCITGVSNPGGRSVELKLVDDSSSTQIDGGHKLHTGARPMGTLARAKGTTDSSGCYSTKYSPQAFSGEYKLTSTISGVTNSTNVKVKIDGFQRLFSGTNHRLIGGGASDCDAPTCTPTVIGSDFAKAHPSNHWAVPSAVENLPKIADDYKAQFYPSTSIPPGEMVHYNDMSLEWGGKFDLDRDWLDGKGKSHGKHREGNHGIDTRSNNIPSGRHNEVMDIFNNNGFGWHDERNKPPTPPHWHLKWDDLTNTVAALNPDSKYSDGVVPTIPGLLSDIVNEAFERNITQDEFEVWFEQLDNAKQQGPGAFLQEMKIFQRQRFGSQEYVARQRTNEQFIRDVFGSHLIREPTETELTFWMDHLFTIQLTQTEEEEDPEDPRTRNTVPLSPFMVRQLFLDDFQTLQEFEAFVGSVVDEVIPEHP